MRVRDYCAKSLPSVNTYDSLATLTTLRVQQWRNQEEEGCTGL